MNGKQTTIKLNALDRVINAVNPSWGMKRLRARATLSSLESTGFISPGKNIRSVQDWNPGANSSDEDSLPNLSDIRAGSRDLSMNTPIATGALKRIKTNVVGSGLTLQSRIDTKFLKLTDKQAADWERNTEREFKVWAESKECSLNKRSNFYEQQSQVIYNTVLSGEVFALLPIIKRPGNPYGLKIKLIEADQCCNPNNGMNTGSRIEGIEYNKYDAEVKYWFRKSNYGDFEEKWTSVNAYGSKGRQNVLHLFDVERIGQRRGIPLLAPVMSHLKQLGRYSDAELMSTIIASFFTVFIKNQTPAGQGFAPVFNPQNQVTSTTNPYDDNKVELGSGAVVELGQDQSIDIADPNRPNENFEGFFLAFVKQIGSALEIPFEALILHFSASYSASRAALLEAWKFYRTRRNWLVSNFCQPIYKEWLKEAILNGRIDAPGFFEDVAIAEAWCGSSWGGPGMGQIDPLKETKAARQRIAGALSTQEDEYTNIHGGNNGSWESSAHRLAREKTLMDELGINQTEEEMNNETNTDEEKEIS